MLTFPTKFLAKTRVGRIGDMVAAFPRFIDDHCLENILDGRRRGVQCGLELEASVPDPHHVIKWAFGGLGSRIYSRSRPHAVPLGSST
jgi:hypothetical protein